MLLVSVAGTDAANGMHALAGLPYMAALAGGVRNPV